MWALALGKLLGGKFHSSYIILQRDYLLFSIVGSYESTNWPVIKGGIKRIVKYLINF